MPLCINVNIENSSQNNNNNNNDNSQGQSSVYNGVGSGNRIVDAAMKWLNKYLPRGATGNNGQYYCNALVGCTLQDLGIWKDYSNANGNLKLLRNDNRFVEIKYTSGEKAMAGDIMCIERFGRSGHNMICVGVDGNGRISKIITAGRSLDPAGRNHVSLTDGNYPSVGSSDYKNLHLFRLK